MYKQLNDDQRAAVLTDSKVSLVVAGAGSGKTRVITSRIHHLINDLGKSPENIISITFTNKTAGEMKERLYAALPNQQRYPFIGTFHSFCLYQMRSNPRFFPSNFSIMDEHDQVSLISRLIKHHGIENKINARKVVGLISRYKNSHDRSLLFKNDQLISELIEKYEIEKERNASLDFDDLILNVLNCLEEKSEFVDHIRNKISHILIDEYQDTNSIQHKLIQKIALDNKKNLQIGSIFAVGDQDQSIYSWRGAQAGNMESFASLFKDTKIFKLEQNYRSVQPILKLANKIIAENEGRLDKNLWSDKVASNCVLEVTAYDEYKEAELIAKSAKQLIKRVKNPQLAVLIRAHSQSRILEEKMIEDGVPYKIVGSVKFYERKEIRDCLALMRFCANNADKESFSRIVDFYAKGIGESFLQNLFEFMGMHKVSNILMALDQVLEEKPFRISKTQTESIGKFKLIFDQLGPISAPSKTLERLVDRTDYKQILENEYLPSDAESRIENVLELVSAARRFEAKFEDPETFKFELDKKMPILSDFLLDVALVQENNEKDGQVPVLIMTLHSAKGLEFDNVIIPGVEDGIIPYKSSDGNISQIQEERRLFYVGITRAKKKLVLTFATNRNHYGKRITCQKSRFLDNVDQELIQTMYCQDPGFTGRIIGDWFSEENSPSNTGAFMSQTIYSGFIPAKIQQKDKEENLSKKEIHPAMKTRTFRKGTLVRHEKFGLGVVQDANKQADGQICLVVAFGREQKKLLSKFLQTIRP